MIIQRKQNILLYTLEPSELKKKTPQHYNSAMVSRLVVTCQDTYGTRQTKLENEIMICED